MTNASGVTDCVCCLFCFELTNATSHVLQCTGAIPFTKTLVVHANTVQYDQPETAHH